MRPNRPLRSQTDDAISTHPVHDYKPVVDNEQNKQRHHRRPKVIEVVSIVVRLSEGAVDKRRVALIDIAPEKWDGDLTEHGHDE